MCLAEKLIKVDLLSSESPAEKPVIGDWKEQRFCGAVKEALQQNSRQHEPQRSSTTPPKTVVG